MTVLPSCAAGEGEGAAGYSITIIPPLPPPLSHGPTRGCTGMQGNLAAHRIQPTGGSAGHVNVHACVRACARVCVCGTVTGLNLPVGNVIKAPHTAGSDAGTGAAAEKGININWAPHQGRPSSHSLTYILIIRALYNKTRICSHASVLLVLSQQRRLGGGEWGVGEREGGGSLKPCEGI